MPTATPTPTGGDDMGGMDMGGATPTSATPSPSPGAAPTPSSTTTTAAGSSDAAAGAATTTPASTKLGHGNTAAILGGITAGAALLGVAGFVISRHVVPTMPMGFHVSDAVIGGAVGALAGGLGGYALTGGTFSPPAKPGTTNPPASGTVVPPFAGVPTTPSDAKVPKTVTGVVEDRTKTVAGGPQLKITKIDAKLDSPVQVTSTPSDPDHIYVVQQGGQIIRTKLDGTGKETVADLSSVVQSGGEQGLLSMAFHPDFASNGRVFVQYTGKDEGATHVAELHVSDGKASGTPKQLMDIPDPYGNHNGGQLQFGSDGDLYIGLGDGGSEGDPQLRGQDLNDFWGKILRIDVDSAPASGKAYAIPKDNPYAKLDAGKPEIYLSGVRNPWRFSFDRSNGDLWIGDVGQNKLEEVDYLPRGTGAGANLGWSAKEGTEKYEDHPMGPGTPVDPVLQYTHDEGAAITGGFVYRGEKIPSLKGYYVYGDYASDEIRALKVEDGKVTDRRAFKGPEGGISGFGEDAHGEIYATALSGDLLQIAPDGAVGGTTGTTPTAPAGATQEVQLSVTGDSLKFNTDTIHVKAGHVKIDLKNDGNMYHNIAIQDHDVHAASKMIAPGRSGSVEADLQPGTYTFYCAPHFYSGMKGTIIVDPA